jgi:hypothetical protein
MQTDKDLLIKAYGILGQSSNQWKGRMTPDGQLFLCNLRDRISDLTNIPQQPLQETVDAGMSELIPMMERMANS